MPLPRLFSAFHVIIHGLNRQFSGAGEAVPANLARAGEQGTLAAYAQSADRALEQYPALHLDDESATRVKHGNLFAYEIPQKERSLARVYSPAGEFIAIAEWRPESGKWQPKKVFTE